MGPQTVSIPSLSGDGVPTIGLTNGRVNRNARHTQIVLWFIQRLLPEGLTQSSHKRHPKVHFSGDGDAAGGADIPIPAEHRALLDGDARVHCGQ
jgi:hypothetical protein